MKGRIVRVTGGDAPGFYVVAEPNFVRAVERIGVAIAHGGEVFDDLGAVRQEALDQFNLKPGEFKRVDRRQIPEPHPDP